jgi:hypothetical protein
MLAWIVLAAIGAVAVLGLLAALWVSRRRERRAAHRGEHRLTRRRGGPR